MTDSDPDTLAGLALNEVLGAHCECDHSAELDKAVLIEKLGPEFRIPGDYNKGHPEPSVAVSQMRKMRTATV